MSWFTSTTSLTISWIKQEKKRRNCMELDLRALDQTDNFIREKYENDSGGLWNLYLAYLICGLSCLNVLFFKTSSWVYSLFFCCMNLKYSVPSQISNEMERRRRKKKESKTKPIYSMKRVIYSPRRMNKRKNGIQSKKWIKK